MPLREIIAVAVYIFVLLVLVETKLVLLERKNTGATSDENTKSPDNQMNWTDYSKSAVALFGLVYLCLVYLCLAIGFGIAGSPYSLNRCIP